MTFRSFAEAVGASGSLVWMWARGESCPGVDYAYAIEEATGGAVRVHHWRSRPGKRAA